MAGTVMGGFKTKSKILAKDPDHYKKIGAMGGKKGRTGGFYVHRDLAKKWGKINGPNRWNRTAPKKGLLDRIFK